MTAQIQIFVSSTFAGFATEREHIARTLPAALKQRLRGRLVEISLVDLRWGLTEVQIQESGVVRACLDAVDRCAPYFVGLIGDHYGSVPAVSRDDENAYPWLRSIESKSITELEILHGVINRGNAFAVFIDRTSEQCDHRLDQIREQIAGSGAPVSRDASSADEMVAFIAENLAKAVLDRLPDEPERVSALSAEHSSVFSGRSELAASLSGLLDARAPIVWVSGAAGAGKSALLAHVIATKNLFEGQRAAIFTFPDEVDQVSFEEALGATYRALASGDAGDVVGTLDVREFSARLEKVAVTCAAQNLTLILVWDNAPAEWLERHRAELLNLPDNVRLVVTSRDQPPLSPGVSALNTPMPTLAEIEAYVVGRLASLGRRLPEQILREFLRSDQICNYHFASIALDELIYVSSHDHLADDIRRLAQTGGAGGLIEQVVSSLDVHFGDTLASYALRAAFYFEAPVPERLLQALLGLDDLAYASLRYALSGAFAPQPSGITLRPSYRSALAASEQYGRSSEADGHAWLATRLSALGWHIDAMRHFFRAGDVKRLLDVFERVTMSPVFDDTIVRAAPWLRWAESQGGSVATAFSRILEDAQNQDGALPRIMLMAVLCDQVLPGSETAAAFHRMIGAAGGPVMRAGSEHRLATTALARRDWDRTIAHAVEALEAAVRHREFDVMPGVLSTLAAGLASNGRPRIAECWLLAAIEILGQMNGRDPSLEATLQSNLGQIYKNTGRFDLALVAAQRAVDLRRAAGESERLPVGLNNLGSVQLAAGQADRAFSTFMEAWRSATELSHPSRGNIAISLVAAQGKRRQRIDKLFASLEAALRADAGVSLDDVVEFYISSSERFAEQADRKAAIQCLQKASAVLLDAPREAALRGEVDFRSRFLSDGRNWTWTGRFKGWPKRAPTEEEPERLWSLFETEEYARFLLGSSLLGLASENGESVAVISKKIDDLPKGPIGGIDWRALREGVGPPPEADDCIVLYSAANRFLAFWVPIVPINPVFIAGLNAVVAASVPALNDGRGGDVNTEGDGWTRVLRRLVEARRAADSELPPELRDAEPSTQRAVCTYFPRLQTFSVSQRTAANGLVFSWLSNTKSAQSMDYPALLWVESEAARPIMYADDGAGLGAPVLVVALEISAGVKTHAGEDAYLGVFTPHGHRTLGKASNDEFRAKAWTAAQRFLSGGDEGDRAE